MEANASLVDSGIAQGCSENVASAETSRQSGGINGGVEPLPETTGEAFSSKKTTA
jgi:hypothetical protein